MKIMILNGSPKRSASDTMHMTCAFVEGMNETAENTVHTMMNLAHTPYMRIQAQKSLSS